MTIYFGIEQLDVCINLDVRELGDFNVLWDYVLG